MYMICIYVHMYMIYVLCNICSMYELNMSGVIYVSYMMFYIPYICYIYYIILYMLYHIFIKHMIHILWMCVCLHTMFISYVYYPIDANNHPQPVYTIHEYILNTWLSLPQCGGRETFWDETCLLFWSFPKIMI